MHKADTSLPKPSIVSVKTQWAKVKHVEFPWLSESPANANLQPFVNLDGAFKKFFSKKSRYPRFKKKGQRDSFYVDNQKMKLFGKKRKLESGYPVTVVPTVAAAAAPTAAFSTPTVAAAAAPTAAFSTPTRLRVAEAALAATAVGAVGYGLWRGRQLKRERAALQFKPGQTPTYGHVLQRLR